MILLTSLRGIPDASFPSPKEILAWRVEPTERIYPDLHLINEGLVVFIFSLTPDQNINWHCTVTTIAIPLEGQEVVGVQLLVISGMWFTKA